MPAARCMARFSFGPDTSTLAPLLEWPVPRTSLACVDSCSPPLAKRKRVPSTAAISVAAAAGEVVKAHAGKRTTRSGKEVGLGHC